MQSDIFYQQLSKIVAQAPDERYRSLIELHTETFNHYLALIGRVTPAATTLYRLFLSDLVTPERLEQTRPHEWKLGSGQILKLPCGWYLWGITVEHIALEHIDDLERVAQV